MFRQRILDLYAINVETGAKSKIADRISNVEPPSLNSRYIVWFSEEDWHAHDLEDGETRNILQTI